MRKILYVQYTNPAGYPSLEHSSRILAANGCKVLLLGTGAFGADGLKLEYHPNIQFRRLPYTRWPGFAVRLHYAYFAVWVLLRSLIYRPDWIYASDPLAAPVARLLRSLIRAGIVYHEHDAPSESTNRGIVMRSRERLLNTADLCVFPNTDRMKLVCGPGNEKNRIVVWNCPQRDEVVHAGDREVEGGLRVFFHGSLNPARLPLSILDVLAEIPEMRFHFAGYETIGFKGYSESLLQAAKDRRVADRVKYWGPVPKRSDLFRICSMSAVGIALMPLRTDDPNMKFMVGASNKPFDYLACGLAVLVSDLPEWRETFVNPGYGLCCDPDSTESIASALRWFLAHPAETRDMGQAGKERIMKEWNYESQFSPVLTRMLDCEARCS